MPLFLSGGVIDNAIIFGAVIILSLCAINMAEVGKKLKIVLYVLMAYSMLFIGAANFMPVVIILGLISLIFFVYILSWSVGRHPEDAHQGNKMSLSSLVILIASVVLLLAAPA